jgi:hypothetical protein
MYTVIRRSILLLVLSFLLGCGSRRPDVHVTSIAATDAANARLWVITRGEVDGQFAFAVFESGPRTDAGLTSAVTSSNNAGGDHRTTIVLTRPNGTTLNLPGNVTLVEIVDGSYGESREVVSLETLDAYIASKPTAFTIDDLLSFAAARETPI